MMKRYFYRTLARYLGFYLNPKDRFVEMDAPKDLLAGYLPSVDWTRVTSGDFQQKVTEDEALRAKCKEADLIFINGSIHYHRDIQALLKNLVSSCREDSKIMITYYSSLWRPVFSFASWIGVREKCPEMNWVDHGDLENFLKLANLELVRRESKFLMPVYIPLLSHLLNRYLSPLPVFRIFNMLNLALVEPRRPNRMEAKPSVSVVVAARNEAGHLSELIDRLPAMSPGDELILVEGNSTDNTWEVIQELAEKHAGKRNIQIAQQPGKGKGDAVRTGFAMAKGDILMILDADMTVPPEDLPKFYEAICSGQGAFINGSRLVYPMEKEAMRFLNMIANKSFALGFSYLLSQRLKDTLCGTKVLWKKDYERIAEHRAYFGEFDPFGDFDLIFGAVRQGLKIIEVPIRYRERTYGDTNIHRWRHGLLLIQMLLFASRRIKFI